MSEMLWIILVCGVGTFLLRWVPLWHARRRKREAANGLAVGRWLSGVGPAAIAALLVVSAWGLLSTAAQPSRIISVVLALACVALVRWLRVGGVALSTLAGSMAYGLLSYYLG